MTHIPQILRSRRVVATLAIVGVAAYLVAPQLIVRGLPLLVLLACPLMMVFMMGPMHGRSAAASAPAAGDPYAREALTRRVAELEAERVAIADLLAAPRTDRPADPSSDAEVRLTPEAHPTHA